MTEGTHHFCHQVTKMMRPLCHVCEKMHSLNGLYGTMSSGVIVHRVASYLAQKRAAAKETI